MPRSPGSGSLPVVVGVDGSPSSLAALRWAISEAFLIDAIVKAVGVWEYPLAASEAGWNPVIRDKIENMKASAGKALAQAVEDATLPGCAVTVEPHLVEGYPPAVLVGESAHAALLVVGSRGHGSFADALLGSVSQHCAHHSKCPVVIMRGPSAQ